MQRLASFVGLASGALLTASCSEGFEDTVWDDDRGTKTLSIYDSGAAWEERGVDTSTGERVVEDGLRFEGVYLDEEEVLAASLQCVSAKNASLATPCDTSVVREITCALVEDDDAKLICDVGEEKVVLYRRGVRHRQGPTVTR